MKRLIVFLISGCLAGAAAAASGRWTQGTDKKSGLAEVRLLSPGGKVLKRLPAQGAREYVPVPVVEVKDAKLRERAKHRGLAFQRLVASEISTTMLDGGRLLLVQEQTVVMPPYPDDVGNLHAAEFSPWSSRAPEQNDIVVTLYDDRGETLWSRKFGPIGALLPAVRPVWTPPSAVSSSTASVASSTATTVKPAP